MQTGYVPLCCSLGCYSKTLQVPIQGRLTFPTPRLGLKRIDVLERLIGLLSHLLGCERERTERKRYAWIQESLTVVVQERKWNRVKSNTWGKRMAP